MKRCSSCGETKPLDDFYCQRKANDRKQSDCKSCQNARTRIWRRDNAQYIALLRASGGTGRTNTRCEECFE